VLGGSNSFTGGTFLRAGKLVITNQNNIGGLGKALNFQGGSLRILGTTFTDMDSLNVNWSTFNGGFDVADPTNTVSINQVIGGSGGLTKDGAGTLVLNAANTFTGNTIINAGVLKLGNPLALQNSTLNFPGTGGALDLNGFSLNIGGIAGSGGFDLAGGTLTVGDNNLSTTFSGVISDSVGGGKLVKIGTGVLTLTGSSSSSFGVIVQGGGGIGATANVASSGSSPFGTSSNGVILDGGKLVDTGSGNIAWDRLFTLGPGGGTLEANSPHFVFNSTGTVPFSSTGNSTLTLSGSNVDNEVKFKLADPSGGKLSLNKVGSGRWILTVGSSQAWTYTGDTTISGGTLIINSSNAILPFGPGKGNLVINGATFSMNGRSGQNINGLNGNGNVVSGTNFTLGNGDASGAFSGVIASSVTGLIKNGAGVQVLSGANTYGGATTINGGVLQFNKSTSIGGTGASVTVNSAGAAAAGYAIDQTFVNRIATTSTGAAALALNSSNALSFSGFSSLKLGGVGNVSYTGALTPDGTTYRLGGGTGTITLPNTNALTGANSLQVFAGGTVSLTASNSYTGGTTVNTGGVLLVNSTNNGAVTITGGSMKITAKAQAASPSGTSKVPAITIPGGTLDITNNAVIVDYTGASSIGSIKSMLDNGTITSSVAGTNQRIGFGEASAMSASSFAGASVDGSAVLMRLTVNGDANLDGTVNSGDFNLLATHFNQSGGYWTAGDLNADGVTNALDFNMLASNFGQAMPEPAMAMVGMLLLARRRRH
jgi:autotransporter-associated beta strand protein